MLRQQFESSSFSKSSPCCRRHFTNAEDENVPLEDPFQHWEIHDLKIDSSGKYRGTERVIQRCKKLKISWSEVRSLRSLKNHFNVVVKRATEKIEKYVYWWKNVHTSASLTQRWNKCFLNHASQGKKYYTYFLLNIQCRFRYKNFSHSRNWE